MSFGSFLSKAVKFAGKAIIEVAGAAINTGPLEINKQYLDKLSALDLDSHQRRLVYNASELNKKAFLIKQKQSDFSREIKSLKENKNEIAKSINSIAKELFSFAKKISPEISLGKTTLDSFISDFDLNIKDEADKENFIKFSELRDEYFEYKQSTAELSNSLDVEIAEHESLLEQHKNEHLEFFQDLKNAINDVRDFGDEKFKERK